MKLSSAMLSLLVCGDLLAPAILNAQVDDFGVPVLPKGGPQQTLGGGLVDIDWNGATAEPTVLIISPANTTQRDVKIFPQTSTADDVVARTTDFVDSHPEFFRIASADLKNLRADDFLDGLAWMIDAEPAYLGIPLLRGYFHLVVTKEGHLMWLRAQLFPSKDLAALDPIPRLAVEEAIAIASEGHEGLREVSPYLYVAFRGAVPFLAWSVTVVTQRNSWQYLIDATTGEVLYIVLAALDLQGNWAFIRGDANGDRTIDLSDAVHILSFLYLGGPLGDCLDASDVNDDGAIDVSDPVSCLSFLFQGGSAPPKPYPRAGLDFTHDPLPCPVLQNL